VWIFGDDDVFEEAAVASALQNIDQGYEQKRIAAAATGGILSSPGKQNGNSDSEVT
jgi:ABC-type glucose/galactose transport system permease subunit